MVQAAPKCFTILTVCTGNVCRSPLAEQLLRQRLVHIPQIRIHSAGTDALVGAPMDATSQQMAVQLGITEPSAHRARQLTAEMLQSADLILGMTSVLRRKFVG